MEGGLGPAKRNRLVNPYIRVLSTNWSENSNVSNSKIDMGCCSIDRLSCCTTLDPPAPNCFRCDTTHSFGISEIP